MEKLFNHHIRSQTPDYAHLLFIREQQKREQFYEQNTEQKKAEFINGEIIVHSPVKIEHTIVGKLLLRLLDTRRGMNKFQIPVLALFDEVENLETMEMIYMQRKTKIPEYLIDEKGNKKAVVVPISEWIQLLEELDDLRAYDEAKSEPSEIIPFEEAIRQIRKGK